MTPAALIAAVKDGQTVSFSETIGAIAEGYRYIPARFTNGVGIDPLVNEPGTNEGSCRIFYFARLHGLDRDQCLALFGEFYRKEVLEHPDGRNHLNIRRFMIDGWDGVRFETAALVPLAPPR